MEQFIYYLKVSLKGIKRAPLPYALTIFILSVGLGVFFANATFYYQLNSDPLPQKSDKLFFPMLNLVPYQCTTDCRTPRVLSYSNVQKLSQSGIPTQAAAMYSADGYLRINATQPPLPVSIRITQRDFFSLFDVPLLHGSVWPDNSARQEVILTKTSAENLFGRTDVVGEKLLLDDRHVTISAVLDSWQMLPRLYDANNHNHLSDADDIYLPLETGYDMNYLSNSQSSTFDDTDYRQLSTQGRTGALHQLQYWVQLDTAAQQQAYRQFMHNLVQDEKAAGRHPSEPNNQLIAMRDIVSYFGGESSDIKAFALVTLLFLLVCLFNASHLSLNRYLSNQYEFGLRRALGASRSQLQLQMLADVLLMALFTIGGALLTGYAGIKLMTELLPANRLFADWDLTLLIALLLLAVICSYLVTLYPSLRASFGTLNQQLKE
ncbi:MAG: ABC transporter permease [Gammaproteobacteria bacterium]|nr:ABC transporter permease [Gammaproteobacteria bacterium]MBU1554436.1 ABC transporter permease [Gammaproteobacteria bacterium]MBU2070214.1 ABC transporter permease [Gammaproteobacteria bacterium]MBU2183535.1 ABC transporter permease [Gammaproteobacteria bacterium]MBU2206637.1 ABC transporter permease [Gammaproteobacteria bacterium]